MAVQLVARSSKSDCWPVPHALLCLTIMKTTWPTQICDQHSHGKTNKFALEGPTDLQVWLCSAGARLHGMHSNSSPKWEGDDQRVQCTAHGLFQHAQELWKQGWNRALYGIATEGNLFYMTESATIWYCYSCPPHILLAGNWHYCAKPIMTILLGAPLTRRRWLQRVHTTRANFINDNFKLRLLHFTGQSRQWTQTSFLNPIMTNHWFKIPKITMNPMNNNRGYL